MPSARMPIAGTRLLLSRKRKNSWRDGIIRWRGPEGEPKRGLKLRSRKANGMAVRSSVGVTSCAGQAQTSLIIACGALVREIQDVLSVNGLDSIEIAAIPALYHNRPEKIVPAVEAHIEAARRDRRFRRIFVAYADCGTGGDLDRLLARYRDVERLPGAHCYEFFSG